MVLNLEYILLHYIVLILLEVHVSFLFSEKVRCYQFICICSLQIFLEGIGECFFSFCNMTRLRLDYIIF